MSEERVIRRRGRPPAGKSAMTPRERKRNQRWRDSRAVTASIGRENEAPLKALLALIGRAEADDAARWSAQCAWQEIGRRYSFVMVT